MSRVSREQLTEICSSRECIIIESFYEGIMASILNKIRVRAALRWVTSLGLVFALVYVNFFSTTVATSAMACAARPVLSCCSSETSCSSAACCGRPAEGATDDQSPRETIQAGKTNAQIISSRLCTMRNAPSSALALLARLRPLGFLPSHHEALQKAPQRVHCEPYWNASSPRGPPLRDLA